MALSPHRRKRAQWRRWPRERYAVCVCQNTDDVNIRWAPALLRFVFYSDLDDFWTPRYIRCVLCLLLMGSTGLQGKGGLYVDPPWGRNSNEQGGSRPEQGGSNPPNPPDNSHTGITFYQLKIFTWRPEGIKSTNQKFRIFDVTESEIINK